MSNFCSGRDDLATVVQGIDAVIDEHRVRAHRTGSIPEKVELITAMSEMRRARALAAGLLTKPD